MKKEKIKPFSRTEMKMLIHNKVKYEGLTYDQAYKQVSEEVKVVQNNSKIPKKKKTFKEEFKIMKNE